MPVDGCSATCTFEQTLRVTALKLRNTTDPTCDGNRFGGAFYDDALDQLQTAIDASVADGSTSILLQMLDLEDLTGTTEAELAVGFLSGVPAAGAGYDGSNDLDWWYQANPADLGIDGRAVDALGGDIAGGILSAGPGSAAFTTVFAGVNVNFSMTSLTLTSATGDSTPPTDSTGDTPGHLPEENLDPALMSFATLGVPTRGLLCGNIGARSLRQAPIPFSYTSGLCDEDYQLYNTLLDLLVSGCHIAIVYPVIRPTQPDRDDPAVPPAGDGPPYTFTVDAMRQVTGCKSAGVAVDLDACLDDAAYSSVFELAADRVLLFGNLPAWIFRDGFESDDFSRWDAAVTP